MRKLIFNLIIGIMFPFIINIRWIPNVYNAIVYNRYEYYDVYVESIQEILYYIYGKYFIIFYIVSLVFVLLPFQLIKNYYYNSVGKISFLKKWRILSSIFLVWIAFIGCFYNIWTSPIWQNIVYILFSVFFGGIIAGFLYIFVDRYEETNGRLSRFGSE